MLTTEEYQSYKKEVDRFLTTFEKYNPEESHLPSFRVRQILYLFLMVLEDDYMEKQNELP